MKKKSKMFCFIMVLTIVVFPFINFGQIVYASNTDYESYESYEQFEKELIEEYADDLQYIFENVATVDENGDIVAVNLTKLKEKYGDSPYFDLLEQNTYNNNEISPFRAKKSFPDCLKDEFSKIIGLDIAKQVFNPQVKKLLASKSWKKASELIVSTLGKKLGKKALAAVVKKMVPGGIPMQIIVSAGKCGIKVIL
ncbi:hypothetical protein [Vagococcus fluvialis]|uniref:Uncharacterized protein n=1 Tax=Vagococcus fluvialis bH819 TaxID=1255619 RepID=A0A1X6WRR6_9ENTE|nr:hypothetical protein [Vagococcus fluvialis]SLM86965.1 hypothetical protein FM121_12785 [Vagococcus fluvialis bH819]